MLLCCKYSIVSRQYMFERWALNSYDIFIDVRGKKNERRTNENWG